MSATAEQAALAESRARSTPAALDAATARGRAKQLLGQGLDVAPLAIALVVLVWIAIWRSFTASLTMDEASSLHTALQPTLDTIRQTIHWELQPPLYYLLLNGWMRLGPDTVEWARMLSTIFASLGLVALWRLGIVLRIPGRWNIIPLIASLTPAVQWTTYTARAYSLTFLLASITCWLFVRTWLVPQEGGRPRDAVLFALSSALAIYTFYYAGFLLAAQGIAGILFGRHRRLLVAANIGIALAILPWLPTIVYQKSSHPNYNSDAPSHDLLTLLSWMRDHWLEGLFHGAPILERPGAVAILLAALGMIAYARIVHLRGHNWRIDAALPIVALLPALCLLMLRVTNIALVEVRYFVTAVVPTVVWMSWLSVDWRPWIRRLIVSIVTLIFAGVSVSHQRHFLEMEDWRDAARYVQEGEVIGEPIFFFYPQGELPFHYYYSGLNELHGIPADLVFDIWTLAEGGLVSTSQLHDIIAKRLGPSRGAWIVEYTLQRSEYGGPILDRFLAEQASELGSKRLWAIKVKHIRVAPEAQLAHASAADRHAVPAKPGSDAR